jgi:hypothetical protein
LLSALVMNAVYYHHNKKKTTTSTTQTRWYDESESEHSHRKLHIIFVAHPSWMSDMIHSRYMLELLLRDRFDNRVENLNCIQK